jgi:hypothetical protein
MESAVTKGLPKPVYFIGIEERNTSLHTMVAILKDDDFGLLSENCLKKATLESFWISHYFWGPAFQALLECGFQIHWKIIIFR